jgi:hypothetical protein
MNYKIAYEKIVSKAKNSNRTKLKNGDKDYVYYEAHHIIPKCMGGEGKACEWKWHNNIVLLTPREHFICHWLLTEIYPNNIKLASCFFRFCKGRQKYHQGKDYYRPSSRMYEYARNKIIEVGISNETRNKMRSSKLGENNPMKRSELSGKNHHMNRPEVKEKVSGVNHYRSKPVNQLSLDGKLLKTWISPSEAAKILNFNQSNITSCCLGRYKSSMGYIWQYV